MGDKLLLNKLNISLVSNLSTWPTFIKPFVKSQHMSSFITMLLALTAFFTPISVSLKSIFLITTSIAVLIQQGSLVTKLFRRPWFFAALLLFTVIVFGSFIGPVGWHVSSDIIGKYTKLLFIPILALGFQSKENRFWAVHGFLLAMLITCLGSFLKILGLFRGIGDGAIDSFMRLDPGAVFYNHIVTGYFMAFAVFLACIFATQAVGIRRYGYCLLIGLFAYQTLFINPGRTGYFMLAILMLVYFIYFFRPSRALSVWVIALFIIASQSTVFKHGMRELLDDFNQYQQGHQNSSLGYRIQFHHYAEQLFYKNALMGVGTGGFAYYFHQDNPVTEWGDQLFEPHGEYWFMAAEHGLLGLFALLFFFCSLFYELSQQKEMRVVFLGMLLTFLMGCFSDGLLLLSVPGYFFIFFVAMGLGEALERIPARVPNNFLHHVLRPGNGEMRGS